VEPVLQVTPLPGPTEASETDIEVDPLEIDLDNDLLATELEAVRKPSPERTESEDDELWDLLGPIDVTPPPATPEADTGRASSREADVEVPASSPEAEGQASSREAKRRASSREADVEVPIAPTSASRLDARQDARPDTETATPRATRPDGNLYA